MGQEYRPLKYIQIEIALTSVLVEDVITRSVGDAEKLVGGAENS